MEGQSTVCPPRPIRALYVHVPFCRSKCAYCAFYSVPRPSRQDVSAFVDRLRRELAAAPTPLTCLSSVYVGGGTPSSLPESELAALLGAIGETFALEPRCEFSVECNPDSLTPEKAAVLAAHGVNRVSLGVQSFDPPLRRRLGRAGDVADVPRALDALRDAGICNIGIDLIYGIPGQSPADWTADVMQACDLGIRHLSTYELSVEEGSRLAEAGVELPDADATAAMWVAAAEVGAAFGLRRYEVSNLAVAGSECRHNMDIWHGGTYLGCGPAAASFDGCRRWQSPADLDAWLAGETPVVDPLPPRQRASEILAFGLRTVAGWRLEAFRDITGVDAHDLRGPQLQSLAEDGLLVFTQTHIAPTEKGLLFADTLATELL